MTFACVSVLWPSLFCVRMLFTKLALHHMLQPLWWNTLSSLSLGWSAPSASSSTWGTGADLTQPPVPEAKVGDHSPYSVTMVT